MKEHQGWFTNRRRPLWGWTLLSLLVALSLVLPPTQLCALMETAPSHSHSTDHAKRSAHFHAGKASHSHSHEKSSSDSHASHTSQSNDHHVAVSRSNGAVLHSLPEPDACCSEMDAPNVVLAIASRSTASDEYVADLCFIPAALPKVQKIFELTYYHGRDGPASNISLPSQLSSSSLLGRAPPILV